MMMIYLRESSPPRLIFQEDLLVAPVDILWDVVVGEGILNGGVPLVHNLLHYSLIAYHFILSLQF